MKIEQRGAEITDIPVFEKIEVTPQEIILFLDDETTRFVSLEALEALRDALSEAIRIKREIDATPAPNTTPRVWNAGDPEPGPEVTKVRDTDGDFWTRGEDGWTGSYWTAKSWSYVLDYAPLTDASHV